jgi:hypothetical protein
MSYDERLISRLVRCALSDDFFHVPPGSEFPSIGKSELSCQSRIQRIQCNTRNRIAKIRRQFLNSQSVAGNCGPQVFILLYSLRSGLTL